MFGRTRFLVTALALLAGVALLVAPPANAVGTAAVVGNAGQSGVLVEIFPVGAATPTASVTSAADGSFTADNMTPGDYQVRFSKLTYVPEWYGGGESRTTATTLSLADDTPVDVSNTLVRGGTIKGTVRVNGVGQNSSSITVMRYLDGAWAADGSKTSSTGGVFTYDLSTAAPVKFFTKTPSSSYQAYPVWYGDAFSRDTATELVVDPGVTVTGKDINAPGVATMKGMLTNTFGGPMRGPVTPYVRDQGQLVPLTATTASYINGFSVLVPAGLEVTLQGSGESGDAFTPLWLGGSADAADAEFRTLAPGETRADLTLSAAAGRGVSGHVTQGYLQGVEGVQVTGWYGDTLMSSATTEYHGYFRLGGLGWSSTARVNIKIEGPGLVTGWLTGGGGLTQDRTYAASYGPWPDSDVTYADVTAVFNPGAQITAIGSASIAGPTISGNYLTVSPPDWSVEPDTVEYWWFHNGTLWSISESPTMQVPPAGGSDYILVVAKKTGYHNGQSSVGFTAREFAATTAPKVLGTPVAGRTLTSAVPSWVAAPTGTEIDWVRDGVDTWYAAPSHMLTTADVGHRFQVRYTGWLGGVSAEAMSAPVLVKAASAMSVTGHARTGRAVFTVKLATPGTSRPGGYLQFYRGAKLMKRVAVTTTPLSSKVRVRAKAGWRRFTVTYTGSSLATSASRRFRLHIG